MNNKGFANLVVIGIVLAIVLGIAGYFLLVRKPITPTETQPPPPEKTTVKLPTSPTKLSTSGAPAEPVDQALAEVTVLSQTEDGWKLHIDKIRDYIRYPAATNPQLKVGDTVSSGFDRWLETVTIRECPAGYTPVFKTTEAQFPGPPPPPQPKIIVGEKYLSELSGCFAEIGGFDCGPAGKGWSASFYNPTIVVIEPECVKEGTTPIPPPEPQR